MTVLIQLIEQYLETHKRLVVPQLGAFLVKEEPRGVVFSELLRRDDGVLHGLLVEKGMSDVAARGEIDRFVYEVRHAIEQGERFYLSDFGEFVPGKNGTIHFDHHPRLKVVPEAPIDIIPDLIEKVRAEVRSAEQKTVDVVEQCPLEPQQPVWAAVADEEMDDESEEDIEEIAEEDLLDETPKIAPQTTPSRSTKPRPTATRGPRPAKQGKKQPDRFLWVAIVAAVIALLAIAFGLYNESLKGEGILSADEPELIEPLIETAAQSDPYGELNK